MKVVILAAGLGTRMGVLTRDLPKPMIKLLGKPILEYKLENLPDVIDEIIIVIGYKGDKIKEYFGNVFNGKKITYVTDKLMSGTASALWQAKKLLNGRFIVLMGDDIYDPLSILECSKYDWSICCKKAKPHDDYSRIILDDNNNLVDFVTAKKYKSLFNDDGLIFTGLYSMTNEIFKYKPVKLKTKEEWGLPQTFLQIAKNNMVNIIETNFWLPISTPKDLKTVELELVNML